MRQMRNQGIPTNLVRLEMVSLVTYMGKASQPKAVVHHTDAYRHAAELRGHRAQRAAHQQRVLGASR